MAQERSKRAKAVVISQANAGPWYLFQGRQEEGLCKICDLPIKARAKFYKLVHGDPEWTNAEIHFPCAMDARMHNNPHLDLISNW